MYDRKTEDEWVIEGDYGYGWDELVTEDSSQKAREQLKCYSENEPNIPHRIRKHRISKEEASS